MFALTTDDASAVLAVIAGYDPKDPYARHRPLSKPGALPARVRVGVPPAGQRVFFGDKRSAADYAAAIDRLARLGSDIVEIDIEPFYEAARLLYEGPWVAERYAVTRAMIASAPEAMHPVTREIMLSGSRTLAVDAFAAFYQLEELRRSARQTFAEIDVLALPTAPTLYTVAQVLADPIQLNSRLGTYTNFVNLLDLCGLAVPAALHDGKTPFGITLLAPGGRDGLIAALGRRFHADTASAARRARACRSRRWRRSPRRSATTSPSPWSARISPACRSTTSSSPIRRASSKTIATAPDYRLYALAGTNPPKPGLLRTAAGAGCADRGRGLGDASRAVRALRRRDPAAAVDRLDPARRRPAGEGLSGRGGSSARRARHFGVRRLAEVRRRRSELSEPPTFIPSFRGGARVSLEPGTLRTNSCNRPKEVWIPGSGPRPAPE